ncbi:MAG: hypothetical protein ACYSTF_08865 [Planctomycetota bacterium]|jgi:hypothetical protein
MKTFCYHCGNVFDVLQTDKGKQIHCPSCRKAFYVDLYNESEPVQGPKPAFRTKPPSALSTIGHICRVFSALNTIIALIFLAAFILSVITFFDKSRVLGLIGAIENGLYLILFFSVACALFAVSQIIKQINRNATSHKHAQP